MREESGESLIGTAAGVIKVRTIRRRAGGARWNKEFFDSVKGTPWEPVLGRDWIEPPVRMGVPDEDRVITPPIDSKEK